MTHRKPFPETAQLPGKGLEVLDTLGMELQVYVSLLT